MSLALLGGGASYEFRWRRWALLRDCVVHHLEGGEPGSRFPLFESIGSALGQGSIRIAPAPLAAELRAMREQLGAIDGEDLVITPATAAVLYPGVSMAAAKTRPLSQAERIGNLSPGDSHNLAEQFEAFLSSSLAVCERAEQTSSEVEVVDF